MDLIIAGGRDFFDIAKFRSGIKKALIHWNIRPERVISGGAFGADTMGIEWAKEAGIPFEIYEPEYWKYPNNKKFAPIARNQKMALMGTHLIAFWDGKSRGTANMIAEMAALHKPMFVFGYNYETRRNRSSLGR